MIALAISALTKKLKLEKISTNKKLRSVKYKIEMY